MIVAGPPGDALADTDADALAALAARCRDADGGLPLTARLPFLRRRWFGEGAAGRVHRDAAGRLIAAAVVRPAGDHGSAITTLVDPTARHTPVAAGLLDWAMGEARRRGGPVTVETEALTPDQAALFGARRLRQVFAEDVLSIDLSRTPPKPRWPQGARLHGWDDVTASRFFAVYEAAFRDRPGFPGLAAEEWIGDLADDDDFRATWSVLVELPEHGDAGFVTAAAGWIDQVGVIPEARGRGLGSALTAEALRRMHADRAGEAWLAVNVDNPAKAVYLRQGFLESGRRARFVLDDPARAGV